MDNCEEIYQEIDEISKEMSFSLSNEIKLSIAQELSDLIINILENSLKKNFLAGKKILGKKEIEEEMEERGFIIEEILKN